MLSKCLDWFDLNYWRYLLMYYCCEEHVELAIDMIVDEEEKAPIMEKIEVEKQLSTLCTFCAEKAIYQLRG